MIQIQHANFRTGIDRIPTEQEFQQRILSAWALRAEVIARIKASKGRTDNRYLTYRTGSYSQSLRGRVFMGGAELSVTHPGANLLEYGGTVYAKSRYVSFRRAGKSKLSLRPTAPYTRNSYMTFRLYRSSDGAVPTGQWVRTRKVTMPARRIIRSSAEEALMYVRAHLPELLAGTA